MMVAGVQVDGLQAWALTSGYRRREALAQRFTRFIPDAQCAANRSKDMNTKVGAVVVDDDLNLRVSGYNGPPRGVQDSPHRLQRPTKYQWMSHAEENCVAQAARMGTSLKDCTIILTALYPCSTCARLIIQSGIKRVLAPDVKMDERWADEWNVSKEMFTEAGVQVWAYDIYNNNDLRLIVR